MGKIMKKKLGVEKQAASLFTYKIEGIFVIYFIF